MGYNPFTEWDYVRETLAWQADEDEREAEEREQEEQERSRYTVAPVRFPAQTSRREP